MVPLGGGEDIGEVAHGFWEGQLSRLEECSYLGPEAGPGLDNLKEQSHLSIYESQKPFGAFSFQQALEER